jgi:hypothetical protein
MGPSSTAEEAAEMELKMEIEKKEEMERRQILNTDWSATVIAILSTVLLLILVWRANVVVDQLKEDTKAQALLTFANSRPDLVCINGSPEVHGSQAFPFFGCADVNGAYYPTPSVRPLLFDPPLFFDLIYAMSMCNIIQSWYEKHDILNFFNKTEPWSPDGPAAMRKLQPESEDLMGALFSNLYTTFGQNFDFVFYVPAMQPSVANPLVRVRYNLTFEAFHGLRMNNSYSADSFKALYQNGSFKGSPPFSEQKLLEAGMLEGTLRVAMLQPGEDMKIARPTWLNLNQDAQTAQCLGARLHDLWQPLVNTSKHLAQMEPCVYSGKSLYVVPALFEPYDCVDYLDTLSWGDWANVLSAVQDSHPVQFLSFTGTYDDMYAVYTGALGALFGAFAIGIVSFTCVCILLVHFASLKAGLYRMLGGCRRKHTKAAAAQARLQRGKLYNRQATEEVKA